MRKVVRIFESLSIICFIFILMNISLSVSAADNIDAVIQVPSNYSATISVICNNANNSVGYNSAGNQILHYGTGTNGEGLLYFTAKNYNKLNTDDKNTFMEKALSATTKASLPAKTKNAIYNFIASQDTPVSNAMKYLKSDANADFVEAKKWFDPWSGVVGTIIGVLCVCIMMFLGLSITLDIFYIVIPGMQLMLDKGEENKKPLLISREAYTSVKDAEKDTEYRNVLSTYLKRRVGLIIILAICLGYLVSGKIYDIVAYLIDSFIL